MLTFVTRFLTLVRHPVTQLGAVVKHVVASVGGCGRHSLAEAAALLALGLDKLVPAVALGEVRAVVEGVLAVRGVCSGGGGGGGGDGLAGGGRARALGTGDSDEDASNAAHLHSSLDADVSLLSPACAPGVLDDPVVHSVLSAVAHHSDGVVGSLSGHTTSEDSSFVLRKGSS